MSTWWRRLLALSTFVIAGWAAWYASAAELGGRCALGREEVWVPRGVYDAAQAQACTA